MHTSGGWRPRRGALMTARFGAGLLLVLTGFAGCGSEDPQPDTATPTEATTQATTQAPEAYLIECVAGNEVQQPSTFTLACADGNQSLEDLTWSDWGAAEATATGRMMVNSCDPSCAEGSAEFYEVTVVASGLTASAYAKLTVTATGERPEGVPEVETFDLITETD